MSANDNRNKITQLGPHDNMSVPAALGYLQLNQPKAMFMAGYDGDGHLMCISSAMTKQDALWLLKQAELYVLDLK